MKKPIERISTGQLTMLAGGVMMGTVFLPISSALARRGGSDASVGLLASAAVAIPMAYFVTHPSLVVFPRKALTAQFRLAFGNIPGRILAAVIAIATLAFASALDRQIADVYILSLMPRTPPWMFSLPVLLLSTVIVLEGIEVLARYSGIIFPVLMVTLTLLIVGTVGRINTSNFLPLFEHGLRLPFNALVIGLCYAGELIIVIWSVVPTINQPRGANLAMLKGATSAAAVLIGINIATIGVFSAPEVARLFYATIDLAKTIQSGGYLRGLESVVIAVFTAASVLKVAAFLLASSRIAADVLSRSDYRPLVVPFAVAIAIGTFLLRDVVKMNRLMDILDYAVMLPSFLVLPLIVRLLGVWNYRRKRAKAASK